MTEFWTSYGFYAWLVTTLVLLGVMGFLFRVLRQLRTVEQRYQDLTRDVDGANLEDIWQARSLQIADNAARLLALERTLHTLGHSSLQHIGLIRFNPFDDVGGDQSFALALLDGNQNGVVVSSIYSRSGGRIYAKPLQAGSKTRVLSQEEEMAIALALGAVEPVLSDET